jgi:hypothetical protein
VDRGGAGFLLPVLNAVSNPTLPKGYPNPEEPTIDSPLYWPAAAPLAPAAGVAYYLFAVWIAGGLVMLALRYRRYGPPDRRRIRWPLLGMLAGLGRRSRDTSW